MDHAYFAANGKLLTSGNIAFFLMNGQGLVAAQP